MEEERRAVRTRATGGQAISRIAGVDPEHASFLMRLVFGKVRKLFGKDLTPQKIQARVPRVFWLYAELRSHFSEEQLIELAADIAQENFRARWNRVSKVGSDGLYCALPKVEPGPGEADAAA